MKPEIQQYNDSQSAEYSVICNELATVISKQLSDAENKIWHGHPVWFIEGNPIVGYSKLKMDSDCFSGVELILMSHN